VAEEDLNVDRCVGVVVQEAVRCAGIVAAGESGGKLQCAFAPAERSADELAAAAVVATASAVDSTELVAERSAVVVAGIVVVVVAVDTVAFVLRQLAVPFSVLPPTFGGRRLPAPLAVDASPLAVVNIRRGVFLPPQIEFERDLLPQQQIVLPLPHLLSPAAVALLVVVPRELIVELHAKNHHSLMMSWA